MKHTIVRIALAALFLAGSLSTLSAEPSQDSQRPQSPIPICWQCGHGVVAGLN